jgi:Family of unknown function (DUF6352)
MTPVREFWQSSGHQLLDRDGCGMLVVTDEFLKAYLARPEVAPPREACSSERSLHAGLLRDPTRPVAPSQIAALADADARENWQLLIELRNHLLSHHTIEAAYLDIVRKGRKIPHLFLNQLVHLILRNALDGCDDPFVVRAAELFFRPQRLALHHGSLLAADEETMKGLGDRPLSPLVSMLGLPPDAEIDVLSEENCASYWQRSDAFDMALDLSANRRGLCALGQVIARWLSHMLALDVSVEPMTELNKVNLAWYVGLTAEGTRIGDALWQGEEIGNATEASVIALYRLVFADRTAVLERLRGEPVYLLAAMAPDKALRLKPQNLIMGLPLSTPEIVG